MGTSMRAVFKYNNYNYYGTTFMHPHAASYTQYTKAACNVLGSKAKSAWSKTTATLHACALFFPIFPSWSTLSAKTEQILSSEHTASQLSFMHDIVYARFNVSR